jgi:hypothetical protein
MTDAAYNKDQLRIFATEMLDNPLFDIAFNTIEQSQLNIIKSSDVEDVAIREHAYAKLKALDAIKFELQNYKHHV